MKDWLKRSQNRLKVSLSPASRPYGNAADMYPVWTDWSLDMTLISRLLIKVSESIKNLYLFSVWKSCIDTSLVVKDWMCNLPCLLHQLNYSAQYSQNNFLFKRYDEWIKADKIVRPANKNVPKIKHRKKIKVKISHAYLFPFLKIVSK